MSSTYLTLSCDSYRNNIFSGFTRLQERQEFVDLTLVADGHLVKVHKNIVALASPSIKEMLQSTSSHNPVIFLNNVSHNVLNYLLEYIYHGEVSVPQDCIESFLQVSQSLHIAGFGNQTSLKSNHSTETRTAQAQVQIPVTTLETPVQSKRPSNIAACITINSDHNFEVEQFIENAQTLNVDDSNYDTHKTNEDQHIVINADISQNKILENPQISCMEIDDGVAQKKDNDNLVPSIQNCSSAKFDSEARLLDLTQPLKLDKDTVDALKIITQYTVTERGAVQIIVSRYIYCSHHNSKQGRKHRWRCADYRKLRCPAYIDSLDNKIVLRKGLHNHAYHDNKIYKKHKQGLIFHSLEQAKLATELPSQNNSRVEDDDDVENSIVFNAIPVSKDD